MNTLTNTTENHGEVIGHIGWKYYNSIKKKAMEQEFSWSGLLLSLSIAFFIVISAAFLLSLAHQSLERSNFNTKTMNSFYKLEFSVEADHKYLNVEHFKDNQLTIDKLSESV